MPSPYSAKSRSACGKVQHGETHIGAVRILVAVVANVLPVVESCAVVCCVPVGIKVTEWQVRAAEDGKTDLFWYIVRVGQRLELAHWGCALCSTGARDESVEIWGAACYMLAKKK